MFIMLVYLVYMKYSSLVWTAASVAASVEFKMKSLLCMSIIFLNFYIKHSLGEEEIEESNLRHFIEGKVAIQGDKLPGITNNVV